MKKHFTAKRTGLFILLTIFTIAAAGAQTNTQLLDTAVRQLAGDINNKLSAERAGKVFVSHFTHNGSIPSFGAYWTNQLNEELANLPSRPFSLLVDNAGAEWIITGEIVELSDSIRMYTRIVRSGDRSILSAFHADFERNAYFTGMLSSGGSRSLPVPMDEWEHDSWENPVTAEIGFGGNMPVMNRTIHDGSDHDYFLLLPGRDGLLIMETTGDIDTYMELYNADTGDLLEDNDDGGSGLNARIEYNVQSGRRYIAKVRGFGDSDTGHYGFRAYFQDR